ncbi:hypothetical protein [Paraburkholderia sp. BL6665CI2N2]|uniref:hypothetical protein n=1 Tax=Paraburkholderia sp. BL6665CI2N2 TaxID=1938806 RepID=UPI0014170267|nr:hypothetical protein [Paraburkholderia sp. BL6665CI2N2]
MATTKMSCERNMQPFVVEVGFKCPACGELSQNTVRLPEPRWDGATQLSHLSGATDVEPQCNHCYRTFNATAAYSGVDATVALDDFPETRVQAGAAGYLMSFDTDWWAHTEAPANPHQIFLDSYHHVGEILANHGGAVGASLINRMVFVQQFGALEAYLGDTLVKQVMADMKAIGRLVRADRALMTRSFGLADMLDEPDIVRREVKSYLKSLLYHRLDQVSSLYQNVLDINIWPSRTVRAELFKAVEYRHDCVHRNGYDLEGTKLEIFTKDWVQNVADATKAVANCIEGQL